MGAYDEIVQRHAKKHGFDPALIQKIIDAESSGNPSAVGDAGKSRGLMQLGPDTVKEMGVTDPMDPEQNIGGGVGYLKKLFDRFGGDQRKGLAAYNFGQGNVAAGKPYPASTNAYLDKILGPQAPPPSPTDVPPPVATAMAAPNPQPGPPPGPPPQPGPPSAPGFMSRALRAADSGIGAASGKIANLMDAGLPSLPSWESVKGAGSKALETAGLSDVGGMAKGAYDKAMTPPQTGPINAAAMAPSPQPDFKVGTTPGPSPEDVTVGTTGNGQDPAGGGPTPSMERALRSDPSVVDMFRDYMSRAPKEQDFKQPWWSKALGGLTAGATGAVEGPSAGVAMAEHLKDAPYHRALSAYKQEGENLGQMAKWDDALKDRNIKEREVAAHEQYWKDVGGAQKERADKYQPGGGRTGAQKVIPVKQQSDAWQMAAERIYATKPEVRKYLNFDQKYGFSLKKPEDRHFWEGDFSPEEIQDMQKVIQMIDEAAGQFTGHLVDPYNRSGQDRTGFGQEEQR